ncbi:MAG: AMP-binding protein, partial [Gammaproteobacteria bacterium]|nr:AMP-binding protein [Gammaproteobacteria bacterium]
DLLWTHCDWAYIAGSFAALYPTLYHGYTVVNYERNERFDAEQAFEIISRYGVTVIFAIATAMRIMMEQVPRPASRYDLSELRQIAVGGETMGSDLLKWSRRELGISFNENYGLTECDYSIANCSLLMEIREGSMGRTIPGHEVAIIDREGNELPPDTYGEIAIRRPNPSMFLGYWNDPEATAARFCGDWFRTGDFATRDADGYFWFVGREDDVIESGGYRIGPGEVEAALKQHSAVADAAVIGVPDRIKGELIKAFVTVKTGVDTNAALEQELRLFVRERLESHAYPKEIEFLRELPVGNTGKVMKRELRRME